MANDMIDFNSARIRRLGKQAQALWVKSLYDSNAFTPDLLSRIRENSAYTFDTGLEDCAYSDVARSLPAIIDADLEAWLVDRLLKTIDQTHGVIVTQDVWANVSEDDDVVCDGKIFKQIEITRDSVCELTALLNRHFGQFIIGTIRKEQFNCNALLNTAAYYAMFSTAYDGDSYIVAELK